MSVDRDTLTFWFALFVYDRSAVSIQSSLASGRNWEFTTKIIIGGNPNNLTKGMEACENHEKRKRKKELECVAWFPGTHGQHGPKRKAPRETWMPVYVSICHRFPSKQNQPTKQKPYLRDHENGKAYLLGIDIAGLRKSHGSRPELPISLSGLQDLSTSQCQIKTFHVLLNATSSEQHQGNYKWSSKGNRTGGCNCSD